MSLSSLSTRAEVLAAYADNAGYEENDSVTEAKAFATACRLLLSPRFTIKRSSHGGRGAEEVELDQKIIADQLTAARQWIASNAASQDGSSVIHPDFTDFRT